MHFVHRTHASNKDECSVGDSSHREHEGQEGCGMDDVCGGGMHRGSIAARDMPVYDWGHDDDS